MQSEYRKLLDLLRGVKSALVAFSGGVDSSLLLAAAVDALGDKVLAVSVESALHPARELVQARQIAESLSVRHLIVKLDELGDPAFCANPPDRCYLCKTKRMIELKAVAKRQNLSVILEGSNADDLGDYRPGLRAVQEHGARSPFIELEMNKIIIRKLARERGLSVWDKPSMACLASRVSYGESLSVERLQRIDSAEEHLRQMGFRELRVRDHGNLARVEVALGELQRLIEEKARKEVVAFLQGLGYQHVCLDLQGFRSGSMNVVG